MKEEGKPAPSLEQRLAEHADLAVGILRRLRRHEPGEESLHRYFATIDNYLSWFTEQRLLALHYRSRSRMSPTRFLSGYDHTREILTLDLSSIARLMDKGSRRVYRLEEGDQVVREEVEKRHLLNLVIRETQGDAPPTLQRWKIVMSRSRIVDVERVHAEGPGHEDAAGW